MYTFTQLILRKAPFLLLAILLMHCEHVGPLEPELEGPGEVPTLSSIQDIFNSSCALSGCHEGSNALLGLNLSEGASYENLVGIPSKEVAELKLVEPGNPDDSYLIIKLEGGPRIAPGTLLMPIGRPELAEEDISRIRAWIAAGASKD